MTDDTKPTGDDKKLEGGDDKKKDEIQLPDDHTLVKSLAAMKQQIKDLKAQNAESADKAKKYDELEEANRSELEKAQAKADELQKKLDDRDAKDAQSKVRAEVAKAKSIPETVLRGSTKEELEEHADELIAGGFKATAAPSTDGQGDNGEPVGAEGEKSADDVVAEATAR